MSKNESRDERRGSALIVVAVMVVSLGTLSLALLTSVGSAHNLDRQVRDETASRYTAEAGLGEGYYSLLTGGAGDLGECKDRIETGTGSYWVESEDLGGGRTSLVSTGVDGRGAARVQLVLKYNARSRWTYGAFGDEALDMDSNTHVDSYDSRLGTWEDQAVNGSGSDIYALTNGDVGSNANVVLSQNATVLGDAVPGPTGSVTLLGTAEVSGSTAPAEDPAEMPEIELPAIDYTGPLSIDGGVVTLAAGQHAYTSLTLNNGELHVQGPAQVVFGRVDLRSNTKVVVDDTNGAVEFYVIDDFVMNSNTFFGASSLDPRTCAVNLLSDNVVNPDANVDLDVVDFESNAKFYGTIYAPYAQIEINSNFEHFGALVARTISLGSWARVHFDEALLDVEGNNTEAYYSRICWQELTVSANNLCK